MHLQSLCLLTLADLHAKPRIVFLPHLLLPTVSMQPDCQTEQIVFSPLD